MVCEHCGSILREGATVCDQCGAQIAPVRSAVGSAGRRQGRDDQKMPSRRVGSVMPAENPADMPRAGAASRKKPRNEGAARPSAQRGIPQPPTDASHPNRGGRRSAGRPVRRMMVNWAMLWLVMGILVFFLAVGAYAYLRLTDQGQLILARMGREANANALWAYGQELLDQGYVDRSIATFEQAYEKQPEREDLYQRLEQLAEAYEAGGRPGDAERIYTKLYSEVDEKNPLAYREIMRLMENQGRHMELSTFLKMAYEKTQDSYFRRQREDLLPSTPTADIEAGSLLRERSVQLLSAEDYDIYYLFGDGGNLPEDGTLYEQPIYLGEGTHVLRAVAVSSDLVSDELRIQYTINLPVPVAPVTSLQPGEYDKRYKIGLNYVPPADERLSGDARQKAITIYYTVDGQTPNSNSPIYTGEKFMLPAGRSTVKAVAVNGYGKVSNVMERTYKVNVAFKGYFNEGDTFSDLAILTTTRDAFVRQYGAPLSEEAIEDRSTANPDCLRLTYSWGEARFTVGTQGYVLYAMESSNTSQSGPRKTRIGMSEKEVTDLFRDMGQASNQDGSRSLYFDSKENKYAMINPVDENSSRIDYSYLRPDQQLVTFSYYLEKGRVVKMGIRSRYTGE